MAPDEIISSFFIPHSKPLEFIRPYKQVPSRRGARTSRQLSQYLLNCMCVSLKPSQSFRRACELTGRA